MKQVNCLICGSEDHEHLATFDNDPYLKRLSKRTDYAVTYVICKTCGFIFTNPMLDGEELDEMYSEKYRPSMPDEKFIRGNLAFMKDRYNWISKQIVEDSGSKKILDIGCSAGTLLKVFKDNGWETRGIEPTESYARYGSEKFGLNIKVDFYTRDSFPDEKFDLIVCLQVLEHVPNPEEILSAMRENLTDEGHLVIGVPTLFRPMMPVHPQTLAAPHLYIFSLNTLRLMLKRNGFDIVDHQHTFKGIITIAKKGIPVTEINLSEVDDYSSLIKAYKEFTEPSSLYNKNLNLLKIHNRDLVPKLDLIPMNPDSIRAVYIEDNGEDYWNVHFKEKDQDTLLHKSNPIKNAAITAEKVLSEGESSKFGTEGIIVMWGFGMGYLPMEVLKRLNKGHILLICEKDADIFKSAMQHVDLEPLLKDERVKILIGEDMPFDTYISKFSKKYMLTGRVYIIRNIDSYRRNHEFYKSLSNRIPDRLKVIAVNRSTIINLGMKMMVNTFENMHLTIEMPGVARLKNIFKDVPAVIVSAGPSLEKNFHLLKEVKGKAIIIAADTVLRLLVPHNIFPDFTITADPQESTYRKFKNIPMDSESFLVCHQINYPDIIRTFAGKKFVMGTQNTIGNWLSEYLPDKGKLDFRAQSVAHMALNLAMLIGANPIIFIGQDLCYYDENKKHAGNLSKGSPWEGKEKRGFVDGKDIFGNNVRTTQLFQSFRVLLNEGVKDSKRTCIDATEGGLGIEGAKVMPLSDAIREYCNTDITDIKDRIISAYKKDTIKNIDGLLNKLDSTAKEIKEIIKDSRKILKDVDRAKKLIDKDKVGTDKYFGVSAMLEKNTKKMRSKEQILNLFPEFAYDLELYMSRQDVIDIDSISDINERFKKQVERSSVYYSKILKVAVPFEEGIKTLSSRLKKMKKLRELAAKPGKDTNAMLRLAKGYKELFAYDDAIEVLEEIVKEKPDNIEALYHLGDIYYIIHHPRKALPLLEKVKKQNPAYMNVKKLIDYCKEKIDFWSEKINDAKIAVNERTEPEQLLYEGEFYYKVGDMEKAENKLKTAIAAQPDFPDPYLDLAAIYESRGEYDKCIEVFEKAMNNIQGNPILYREIGFFSGRLGDMDRAVEFLNAATEIDAAVCVNAGDFFLSLDAYDKALPFYEKAALNDPGAADLQAKTALCYAKIIANQPVADA